MRIDFFRTIILFLFTVMDLMSLGFSLSISAFARFYVIDENVNIFQLGLFFTAEPSFFNTTFMFGWQPPLPFYNPRIAPATVNFLRLRR